MGNQTFVVQISTDIARRMRAFLSSGAHGYETVSEFIEVAVLNQLEAEATGDKTGRSRRPSDARSDRIDASAMPSGFAAPSRWLERPAPSPVLEVASTARSNEPLSALTNRLGPIKVAVRVAAMLAGRGAWPELREFQRIAADAARQLGFALRDRDTSDVKLSVGFPVGDDAEKSATRFVNSFTLTERDGRVAGPLFALGLATVIDGRFVLTRDGWRLAAAPSPLVDGAQGTTLSAPEAKVFRDAMLRANSERDAIAVFLRIVMSQAQQTEVDAKLSAENPSWSRDQIVAHRAAMVGRLTDAEMIESQGRGTQARLRLLPAAQAFLNDLSISKDSTVTDVEIEAD